MKSFVSEQDYQSTPDALGLLNSSINENNVTVEKFQKTRNVEYPFCISNCDEGKISFVQNLSQLLKFAVKYGGQAIVRQKKTKDHEAGYTVDWAKFVFNIRNGKLITI